MRPYAREYAFITAQKKQARVEPVFLDDFQQNSLDACTSYKNDTDGLTTDQSVQVKPCPSIVVTYIRPSSIRVEAEPIIQRDHAY